MYTKCGYVVCESCGACSRSRRAPPEALEVCCLILILGLMRQRPTATWAIKHKGHGTAGSAYAKKGTSYLGQSEQRIRFAYGCCNKQCQTCGSSKYAPAPAAFVARLPHAVIDGFKRVLSKIQSIVAMYHELDCSSNPLGCS
jgi:hypothetical protein